MLIVAGLASLLGCQGLSSKPQTQGAGQLTPSPASISFGNVQVGTNQSQGGSVTNTGGSSVTITQVTASGSGFSVSGLNVPLTLAAGQGANFSVVFAPASTGSASGNVAFSSSVGTLNVGLSGTGVAVGALTTNPTSFAFGNVLLGYSSSQTETLKNTGGESLTITVANISGAGFSYSGLNLPLTLAPNQASTFGVNFAPTVAGVSSGSLALTVSGSSTSVDIGLSGDGRNSCNFDTQPHQSHVHERTSRPEFDANGDRDQHGRFECADNSGDPKRDRIQRFGNHAAGHADTGAGHVFQCDVRAASGRELHRECLHHIECFELKFERAAGRIGGEWDADHVGCDHSNQCRQRGSRDEWHANRDVNGHRWYGGSFFGEPGRHKPGGVFRYRSLISGDRYHEPACFLYSDIHARCYGRCLGISFVCQQCFELADGRYPDRHGHASACTHGPIDMESQRLRGSPATTSIGRSSVRVPAVAIPPLAPRRVQ
jgi:hypothetical protein